MGKYVAENVVKNMMKADKQIKGSKVAMFGITFKENCPDIRNTKAVDIIKELDEYEIKVKVVDPVANKEELQNIHGMKLYDIEEIKNIDSVIFSVSHEEFKDIELKV